MEKVLLQNSSPTLIGAYLQAHILNMKNACKIIRAKKISLTIKAYVDDEENPIVIALSELPKDLYDGFHSYATTLIAQRHEIEKALREAEAKILQ